MRRGAAAARRLRISRAFSCLTAFGLMVNFGLSGRALVSDQRRRSVRGSGGMLWDVPTCRAASRTYGCNRDVSGVRHACRGLRGPLPDGGVFRCDAVSGGRRRGGGPLRRLAASFARGTSAIGLHERLRRDGEMPDAASVRIELVRAGCCFYPNQPRFVCSPLPAVLRSLPLRKRVFPLIARASVACSACRMLIKRVAICRSSRFNARLGRSWS